MQRRIRNMLIAMVAVVAMAFGSSAHASFHLGLQIFVLENGDRTLVYEGFEGDFLEDNNFDIPFSFDLNVGQTVNPVLLSLGIPIEFTTIEATANNSELAPGHGGPAATLGQSGVVQYLSGAPGAGQSVTFEVWASAIDYTFPASPIIMESTTSGSSSQAAGGNRVEFQSFFDPENRHIHDIDIETSLVNLFDTTVDSPLLASNLRGTDSFGLTATPTPTPGTLPFSLINVARVTVGPGNALIRWDGNTVVIPEPAAMSLFLLGLPAAGLLLRRRARQRQQA